MKKFCKVITILMAVVTFFSIYALPVSAASKLKLNKYTMKNHDSMYNMGQNLYEVIYYDYSNNSSDKEYYRSVYEINTDCLEAWRETDSLIYAEYFPFFDIGGNWGSFWDCNFAYSNCALFKENETGKKFVAKYDNKKKTIARVYSTDNYVGISKNGSIFDFSFNNNKNTLTVKISNSNGKLVKKLTFKNDYYTSWLAPRCGYNYALVSLTKKTGNNTLETQLVRIDSKGKKKIIYTHKSTDKDFRGDYFSLHNTGENYASMYVYPGSQVSPNLIYSLSKNKIYKFSNIIYNENAKAKCNILSEFGDRIYGTKAVARYTNSDNSAQRYALVDVKADKYISKTYKYMETWDGKMFLVQLESDKYGYINSSGKLLATFDKAAPFNGDYAPVIKKGKAYLINRKMKQVSQTIKVSKNATIHSGEDDLYYIVDNDNITLFTYE